VKRGDLFSKPGTDRQKKGMRGKPERQPVGEGVLERDLPYQTKKGLLECGEEASLVYSSFQTGGGGVTSGREKPLYMLRISRGNESESLKINGTRKNFPFREKDPIS